MLDIIFKLFYCVGILVMIFWDLSIFNQSLEECSNLTHILEFLFLLWNFGVFCTYFILILIFSMVLYLVDFSFIAFWEGGIQCIFFETIKVKSVSVLIFHSLWAVWLWQWAICMIYFIKIVKFFIFHLSKHETKA
jgi:hypothetical protein